MAENLVLTAAERAEIDGLVDDVLARLDAWEPLEFVEQSAAYAQELPLRLRRFLAHVRTTESDVSVVSGLPIDADLPPTPVGWDLAAKNGGGSREELVLMLCGSALGEPFGWSNQQNGRIVHDVVPAPGMEDSLTSASSSAELSLHTEDVFHPCRGDYVCLFCLRNPHRVGTTYVSVSALDLPADMRAVLATDAFRFLPDDSHVGLGSGPPSAGGGADLAPVLFGPSDKPYFRFDVDFMEAGAPGGQAAEAIAEVARRMTGVVENVVLAPGEAMFVDNYRVVHGRQSFAARYDGLDRWLKRLNLIRDVRRIYASSPVRSRIIVC